jgi:hypothetical protein
VVGASRAESQEPDAWGVACKGKSPTLDPTPEPKGETFSEIREVAEPPVSSSIHSSDAYEKELPSTNWDEYGGRDLGTDKTRQGLYFPEEIPAEDDQKMAMVRKAKDRAAAKRAEEGSRQNEQRERASQRLRELDQKTGPETKPRTLFDPNTSSMNESAIESTPPNGINGIHTPEVDSTSRPPIQLSSFDDRDRGERGASATPRMLYDPKSGSMVAVPSKDDASAVRGRKERGKKVKIIRDKEAKPEEKNDSDGKRKGKREKKVGNDPISLLKPELKKGKGSAERKFPRTYGVLYSRDDKGNFVSVDGCDGDLGYGSHSVPGGRVNNAEAYEKFLATQKNSQNEARMYHGGVLDASFDATDGNYGDDDVLLHTGYSIPDSQEATFDWVKPSDRIELMTGVDGSPTLQATAKEWAPSQAALAAATARFGSRLERHASFDADEGEVEDDGPVSISFVVHVSNFPRH